MHANATTATCSELAVMYHLPYGPGPRFFNDTTLKKGLFMPGDNTALYRIGSGIIRR